MMDIIKDEINSFLYNDIEIVDGLHFNQYETIKRIHKYMNSSFDGPAPDDAIFHNIVKSRKVAAARFLNIDTKDIKLHPMNPASEYSVMFLEQELKYWVKKNKINVMLNEIADDLATYGTAVLKKTGKGAELVDLRRLFIDPGVKDILESRFITIKHILTPSQLRKKKKDGWDADAIERIINVVKEDSSSSANSYEGEDNANSFNTPLIEIYERYGETEKQYMEGGKEGDEDVVSALTIVAEPFRSVVKVNDRGDAYDEDQCETLYNKEWKGDFPFSDIHYSREKGRWLGVGVVEDLFEAQERINEIENQKRGAMEISSLQLYRSSKTTIVQNTITDLINGDVIISDDFAPVDTRVKDLSSFQDEYQTYTALADRISFASELISGGDIPVSTPATNAVIQNNNATSVFLFKRENYALVLQEFFNEFVLPQVLKDLSKEHVVRYMGDVSNLDLLDTVFINEKKVQAVLNAGLKPVTPEEIAALEFSAKEELSKTGNARYAKIKENLYGDLEFEFDIIIANEQENVALIAQNSLSLLTAFAQNPQLLDDPLFKTLFFDYAQRVGINPARLEIADSKRKTQQQVDPSSPEGVQKLLQEVKEKGQPKELANV